MAGMNDVAKAAGLKTSQVEEVFLQIMNYVKKDHRVRINGFGTFSKGLYKGRTLETPAVNGGVPLKIPDTNVLKFRQSAQAKQRLNSKKTTAKKSTKKAAKKSAKKTAKKASKKKTAKKG